MYIQIKPDQNVAKQARHFLQGLKLSPGAQAALRRDFAEYMVTSVKRNFEAGGRPRRWKPSRRAETTGGKTLMKTARLKNSITGRVRGKSVLVGTNVAYAAAHQGGYRGVVSQRVRAYTRRNRRGGTSTVRAHDRRMRINLPPRPFLKVQREDRAYMNRKTLLAVGIRPGGMP